MGKYTSNPGIYIIANTKTGMIYIGQAQNIPERWKVHKRDLKFNRHTNTHLQRAFNLCGEKHFEYRVLEYCSLELLDAREQHYLDIHMPKGICYNIAKDSKAPMRGTKASDETRQKMKASHKLRPKISEETRAKMSKAQKGHSMSDAAKEKLRQANIGKTVSEELKQKQRERMMGNQHSKGYYPNEETRKKLSASHTGDKNPNFGKTFSDEHRRKLSVSHMGNKQTEETKKKISETLKKRNLTDNP